jgi:hypothetical protein
MRNGDDLVSSQRAGLLSVEEPSVPVVEGHTVVFLMIQKLRLVLILTATKFQFGEH